MSDDLIRLEASAVRTASDPDAPWATRHVAAVSAFTLGSQMLALGSQIVFAILFGASDSSDAFFAALALPLYLTTVLISSLAVVLVPALVEHRTRTGFAEADVIATGTMNVSALALVAIALAGMLLADPLLAWSAPGLDISTRLLATALANILWPSAVASGLAALLTASWQIEHRFAWPAAVPLVGAGANLALILTLGPLLGVVGVAIAWTASSWLQVVLLAPIAARRWSPSVAIRHPAIIAIFTAIGPLVLANVFIRASTVLERYLASVLPPGELSQVAYASRIVTTLGVLAAAGPAVVIFPRLAEDAAARDTTRLGAKVSIGLSRLWLVVAPGIALLVALANPAIRVLLEHGAFTRSDTEAVAGLVSVYAPSVAAVALGAITGHAIYALKATRLIAIVGAAEGLAYIVYTTFLAQRLGAPGIALGFSIYYVGSLAWQLLYLRRVTQRSGIRMARSFVITGAVAGLAGLAAWLAGSGVEHPLIALLWGSVAGLTVYAVGMAFVRAAGRSWIVS